MGEGIKSDALRRVFVEFVNNIFEDDASPKDKSENINSNVTILHYDRLYQIICDEIEKVNPSRPALVSWIKDEDRTKAIEESTEIPTISSINDPFGMIEPEYPEVNFDYFYESNEHNSVEKIFEMEDLLFAMGASDLDCGVCLKKNQKRYRRNSSFKPRKLK